MQLRWILKEKLCGFGLDSAGSGYGTVVVSC